MLINLISNVKTDMIQLFSYWFSNMFETTLACESALSAIMIMTPKHKVSRIFDENLASK